MKLKNQAKTKKNMNQTKPLTFRGREPRILMIYLVIKQFFLKIISILNIFPSTRPG